MSFFRASKVAADRLKVIEIIEADRLRLIGQVRKLTEENARLRTTIAAWEAVDDEIESAALAFLHEPTQPIDADDIRFGGEVGSIELPKISPPITRNIA